MNNNSYGPPHHLKYKNFWTVNIYTVLGYLMRNCIFICTYLNFSACGKFFPCTFDNFELHIVKIILGITAFGKGLLYFELPIYAKKDMRFSQQ
jgi:hypothetical protein